MKILELTNFSAGLCGVGARVKEEAVRLSKKGHEVVIFSSNFTKGNNLIAPSRDNIENVKIFRFAAKKLGGESFMKWDFEHAALEFKPDVIIAHSYRHVHTTKALKIAKKLGARVYLVTHAPFVETNKTRSLTSHLSVKFYDTFIGRKTLNQFNKVLIIAEWERPHLRKLGVIDSKIEYVPNGIPEEFFTTKARTSSNKILFLGRVSPIKDLETLIRALNLTKTKIALEIVGPTEEAYANKLKTLISDLKLGARVKFSPPIYQIKEKISKIDSAKIFVLPSLREGLPQSLMEAMARARVVISSDNEGSRPLIQEGKNGYLFKISNAKELAKKIDLAVHASSALGKNAKKSMESFSWNAVIKKLERVITS